MASPNDQVFIAKKKKVTEALEYFKGNSDKYKEYKKFLKKTTYDEGEVARLNKAKKSAMEFNVLEPIVNQKLGDAYKSVPGITAKTKASKTFTLPPNQNLQDQEPITVTQDELYAGIIKNILFKSDSTQDWRNTMWTDSFIGGYGSAFINTEFDEEDSFVQSIIAGLPYDNTQIFFDSLAKQPHKGDGKFCGETCPMDIDDFSEKYPEEDISKLNFKSNTNWAYTHNDIKYVLVCTLYEKVLDKTITLHELKDGTALTDKEYAKMKLVFDEQEKAGAVDVLMKIKRTRKIRKFRIDQTIMYEGGILEKIKTARTLLPIVFADGDSLDYWSDDGKRYQETRPFFYNAQGCQKLKNLAGSTIAYELAVMAGWKLLVPEESISKNASHSKSMTEPTLSAVAIYRSKDDLNNPLPVAPREMQPANLPPYVESIFFTANKDIQAILGTPDAAIGTNNPNVSGVAIDKAIMSSNPVVAPYIKNHLAALQQVCNIIVDLIKIHYMVERTVHVELSDGTTRAIVINKKILGPNNKKVIDPNQPNLLVEGKIDVCVTPTANYEQEKQASLNFLMQLATTLPSFSEFLQQKGMPVVLENLNMPGSKDLLEQWKKWSIDQAKNSTQSAQPTPAEIQQMQNATEELNLKGRAVSVKEQETRLKGEKNQLDYQIEQQKLGVDVAKFHGQMTNEAEKNEVDMIKTKSTSDIANTDMALRAHNQEHNHSMDMIDVLSKAVK